MRRIHQWVRASDLPEIGSEVARMSLLIAVALLLFGLGVIASMVVTLLVMVSPIIAAVLLGYGIWRLVSALRAVEKARATAPATSKGEK